MTLLQAPGWVIKHAVVDLWQNLLNEDFIVESHYNLNCCMIQGFDLKTKKLNTDLSQKNMLRTSL